MFRKGITLLTMLSIVVVLAGIAMSTIVDYGVGAASMTGLVVAVVSTVTSAAYQVMASALQKEYSINGIQLLLECSPPAALIMILMVPFVDNLGITHPTDDTLLGYPYTWQTVMILIGSGFVGLLVTASAFQAIGHTSALTYNVLGYIKTIAIVSGGWMLFGEVMALWKALGVFMTIAGIAGYSYSKYTELRK